MFPGLYALVDFVTNKEFRENNFPGCKTNKGGRSFNAWPAFPMEVPVQFFILLNVDKTVFIIIQ